MTKTRILVVFFLLAFIVTLVLTVPVRLLWHHGGSQLGLPVEPRNLSGNLWQGSGDATLAGEEWRLHWQIDPKTLGSAHVGYAISVNSNGMDLQGRLDYRPGSYRVTGLEGYADMARANPWLRLVDTELEGRLLVDNLDLQWRPGNGQVSGDGRLDWQNGHAAFNWIDGQRRSVSLPPIEGAINTDSEGLTRALIRDVDSDMPILLAELDSDSELMYRIYTHLRDVLQVEMPGGQEVIMEGQTNVREWLL